MIFEFQSMLPHLRSCGQSTSILYFLSKSTVIFAAVFKVEITNHFRQIVFNDDFEICVQSHHLHSNKSGTKILPCGEPVVSTVHLPTLPPTVLE